MKLSKSEIIALLVVSFIVGISGGVVGTLLVNQVTISEKRQPVFVKNDTKDELSTVDAVGIVSPSVVSVVIFHDIATFSNRTGPDIFKFDDFFESPFNFEHEGNLDPRRQQVGGGSGFIISSDGLIVTNKHVIDDDEAEFVVILQDGTEYEATILGKDPFNDLAVLKIEAENLPTVSLGNSDTISIGESVIAIGNSLGEYQNTVTKGIISGVNRRVIAGNSGNTELIEEAIQTDAAINPGNSGGPLINLSGEVIGVNTAISRSGQLIGFAIPINTAKSIVDSVIEFGRIVRPWLGVRYMIITENLATERDLGHTTGAYISDGGVDAPGVIEDSPASKAGVQSGDIILKVDEIEINNDNPLGKVIGSYKPGDILELTIFREEKVLTLSVVLEEFKN